LKVGKILDSVRAFETEAHQILATEETSPSRVITIKATYEKLNNLSLKQDELFRQAIDCAKYGFYRAAYVLAWAGAVDVIFEVLDVNFATLQAAKPDWKGADVHEMAEYKPEYDFVTVVKDLNLATKNQAKSLYGLLHRRNEAAHPTDYTPDINMTLGYISEVLDVVKRFKERQTPSP
jgi:hypothetical protein